MYLLNISWFQGIGFQSVRSIIELLYFISGIAVFITAIFQLFSTKKSLKIKSKREAITVSSQQFDRFYKELVPLVDKISETFRENKLNGLLITRGQRANFNKIEASSSNFKKVIKFLNENEEFAQEMLYCTNMFESFSTYFTTGVADSDTALNIIGAPYCSCIETLYIMIYIGTSGDNRYPSIKKLYEAWSTKIDSRKLELNLAELLLDRLFFVKTTLY